MESPESYLANSNMQRRDTIEIIVEFSCELSNMRGKCIDIGCGPGQITKDILLPFLSEETEMIGADISQEMINYARQNYADKRLSYVIMDIESDLPSDEIEHYDNTVSFYCLHWCKDIRYAFENIYKLLRPQGTALIMFLSHHIGFEAYLRLKEDPRFQPYLQDVRRYLPYFQRKRYKDIEANAQKMLENTGFKILHCSNRKKSFHFTKTSLTDSACAVNPFMKRFPDENLKKEFLEEFIKEIISLNQNVPLKKSKEDQKEYVTLPYYLLVAHVQKP
ncbi:juvenile hormone acid O-methyltransferase [Camponotus floridanus]|uniref:juvenile hormone acid O-methyltransferase n=1 Tax=Camponotus floridanus TaxID=104421 RepID=UPI000DC6A5AC|nr:juvenile hormone acid O-methyltransferase [Camponotus floridanus]XP_025268131.1 juvenile hormone acid O-methyltransferase [Camponotus floridanus]